MSEDDLRGSVPESWCCVDCGVNTAPGFSTRAEMEAAFAALGDGDGLRQTLNSETELYTVRKGVWGAAGMKPYGGCLCIRCLEQRLGRRLKSKDFKRGHPFNDVGLPGTPLRAARLLGALDREPT